jgi:hypothetical protein
MGIWAVCLFPFSISARHEGPRAAESSSPVFLIFLGCFSPPPDPRNPRRPLFVLGEVSLAGEDRPSDLLCRPQLFYLRAASSANPAGCCSIRAPVASCSRKRRRISSQQGTSGCWLSLVGARPLPSYCLTSRLSSAVPGPCPLFRLN